MDSFRRIIITFVFVVLGVMYSNAQELKLESVAMEMMTQTVPMQRQDLNGQVCALVKVIMPGEKVVFEGSVIGECPYKTSEYWCYLSPGTKSLKIKYPNLKPLLVDFKEYFGSGVKSNRIYNIVVKVPITRRDIHKGPLSGTCNGDKFGLNREDFTLFYIHSSTGERDYIPLDKYMKFAITEAHEGDSLILISSNKAFINVATEITLKDIVNESIELKGPHKTKRKPFNIYVVDCITNDTLPNVYLNCILADWLNTDYPHLKYRPDEIWEKMEIDKTYIVEYNFLDNYDRYENNDPYMGLWDLNERVEVKPFDESDIVLKLRSPETPDLCFWIGVKGKVSDIRITTINNKFPEYHQWLNKSNEYYRQGTFYAFKGFPVVFPATFRFSAEGYKTMQITFYEEPQYANSISTLKNGKTVFMMNEGDSLEIEYYEYRNGKLKKRKA